MKKSPSTATGLHGRGDHTAGDQTAPLLPLSTGGSGQAGAGRKGGFNPVAASPKSPHAAPETPVTPKTHRRHRMYGVSSMLLLMLQGTTMSIVLRYSRIRTGLKYTPSVAGG